MTHPFGTAELFAGLAQKSTKVSSYFAVYDRLLEGYRGHHGVNTMVEIVADGGSLIVWREFFGPSARIIGVDLDPAAAAMREKGFEIFIGDQSAPEFWQDFFAEVGDVDIIVDDGGHTNRHQIVTVDCCIDHVKDGGLLLIEDVGTSYLLEYGNPSRFSFVSYSKGLVDRLQLRGPLVRTRPSDKFTKSVYSISFFESIICLFVDRRLCGSSKIVHAGGEDIGSLNRWNEDKRLVGFEAGRRGREILRKLPTPVASAAIASYAWLNAFVSRRKFLSENRSLRRFF